MDFICMKTFPYTTHQFTAYYSFELDRILFSHTSPFRFILPGIANSGNKVLISIQICPVDITLPTVGK